MEDLSQYDITVLVAEDNGTNQMIIANLLNRIGINTVLVENGEAAISKLEEQKFDLVLMDLQMPVMDGYEATKRIRSMSGVAFRDIPILALTSSIMYNVIDKVMDTGMNGFLSKNFSPDEIKKKLLEHLDIGKESPSSPSAGTEGGTVDPQQPKEDPLGTMAGLSRGDEGFRKELARLYINNIEELQHSYLQAIRSHDPVLAGKIAHKVKFTLESLRAETLIGLIGEGRQMLGQDSIGEEKKESFCRNFTQATEGLIDTLKKI